MSRVHQVALVAVNEDQYAELRVTHTNHRYITSITLGSVQVVGRTLSRVSDTATVVVSEVEGEYRAARINAALNRARTLLTSGQLNDKLNEASESRYASYCE